MTDTPEQNEQPEIPETPEKPTEADRIAKVIARAGVASRREAERMIVEGRVTVNGQKIDSPALDVLPGDRITVDGKKLDEKQETRLWLYYKPVGLVTSESDEKGRQTVFDALPRDLPRVMTVGRLDLNSEGLLLLTNDGELKRRLELPATGWLRRYRVRVNGNPSDLTFAPLRRGATIDDEDFAPMEIKLDSQQGANAWLTVGIREGRNREIRRAMAHVGLQVNRLIRIGYGPFKLLGLEKNQVTEVKRKVLRDQLGGLLTGEVVEKDREMRPYGAAGGPRGRDDNRDGAGRSPRRFGEDRPRREDGEGGRGFRPARRDGDEGKPRFRKDDGPRSFDRPRGPRAEGDQGDRPRRSFGGKPDGDRPARGGKPWEKSDRPRGPRAEGDQGDRPRRSFGGKPDGDRPARGGKPWEKSDRPRGPRAEGDQGDRPRRSFGGKPDGDRPARGGKPWEKSDRPRGPRAEGDQGDRPRRSFGGKPDAGRPARASKPWDKSDRPRGAGGDQESRPRRFGAKPAGAPGAAGGARKPFGKAPGGNPAGRPGGKPGGGRPSGKPRGPRA